MDPNSQVPNPEQPISDPVAPSPPVALPPQPPISADTSPATPNAAPTFAPIAASSTRSNKKTGLVIAAIMGLVLLLLAGTLLWIFLLSPTAQAKKISTQFMKAVTTGDNATLYKLANTNDDSVKQFLDSAAKSSKGNFTLNQKTMKDGSGYFLYDLTNDKTKHARTIVKKADGKWYVDSYVFGSSSLALVPGESSDQKTATTGTETTESTASKCLVSSDFNAMYQEMYSQAPTSDFSKFGISGNIHFKPDSLEYADQGSEEYIIPYAHFARDHKDKDFMIEIYGGVGTDVQADIAFADKRVDKVEGVYLANGGVASKLDPIASTKVTDFRTSPVTKTDQAANRVVVFKIVPSTACSGTNNSFYRL